MAAGIESYQLLPRNEDPHLPSKLRWSLHMARPGANLPDTVNLVTDPLEKKLQEIPWLGYVQSETHAGQSVIFINLRDDTPRLRLLEPGIWFAKKCMT